MEKKSIVLVGCGHANALALLALRAQAPEIDICVIEPKSHAVYSGMLPGLVAGHYTPEMIHIDVARVCKSVGATLLRDAVTSIDAAARRVETASGRAVAFDAGAIDVGITSDMPNLPGFKTWCTPVKPLNDFATRWEAYVAGEARPKVAVIGGGAAGVELILAMAHRAAREGKSGDFHLIDRGLVASQMAPRLRDRVMRALSDMGITIHAGRTIERASDKGLHLHDGETIGHDGETIEANFIVGAAGATPHPQLASSGLDLTAGFIDVDAHLQSSVRGLFAVGDCANFVQSPLPKAGVYAVRQAPVLAQNLIRSVTGRPLRRYYPQNDYLKLVSLGARSAVAEKYGVQVSGAWAWRLKDRIDRKFMAKFAR